MDDQEVAETLALLIKRVSSLEEQVNRLQKELRNVRNTTISPEAFNERLKSR